jgi:hypothetical protein
MLIHFRLDAHPDKTLSYLILALSYYMVDNKQSTINLPCVFRNLLLKKITTFVSQKTT